VQLVVMVYTIIANEHNGTNTMRLCNDHEKSPYVHTKENQENILPRGGPIQNPLPPLLEVVSPQYKVTQ